MLGANGQLGRALCRTLDARKGAVSLVAAWTRRDCDLERVSASEAALAALCAQGANVVVNTAAMTAVDRCEGEPELAWRVNAEGPAVLAELCARLGMRLVHLSTDYVFSGRGEQPWAERDRPAPRSVYGKTKLEGETRVLESGAEALVVRTAWLYGDGANFVRTILAAAGRAQRGEGPPLRVVNDQSGSPTYAGHLAGGLIGLLERGATGIYHLANSGAATWWDLACEAVREASARGTSLEVAIEPVSSDAFPRPAPRPAWSVLDLTRAREAGVSMPGWREGLRAYLDSPESPLHRVHGG